MKQDDHKFAGLRRRAEAMIARLDQAQNPVAADALALQQELNVYQAELEIQNEHLQASQTALAASNQRFQLLFNLAPAGYFVLDDKSRIVDLNLMAADILNLTREQARGQLLSRFVGDRLPALMRRIKRTLEQKRPERLEAELTRSHEAALWVRMDLAALPADEEREAPRALCVVSDITRERDRIKHLEAYGSGLEELARKRAGQVDRHKNELLLAQKELEQQAAAREAAEAAGRMKDEFINALSHELRTPLTGVIASAQTLSRGKAKNRLDAGAEQRLIAQIIDSGRLLNRFIDDVMILAADAAGRLKVDLRPTAVDEVLDHVALEYKEGAAAKGVALTCRCAPDLAPVLADAARLEEAVGRLVDNAVKFTERGGVLLEGRPSETRAGFIDLVVLDDGPGLPLDGHARLFQRFVRLDDSGANPGAGLGLPVVKKLVEVMAGDVSAADRPEGGAAFTLTLPAARP